MYKRFRGLWVCVMLCLLLPTMALAAGSVAIDSIHFPDDSFREIVYTFDKNVDWVLSDSELEMATSIDCSNKGISSLKGIEYFTKLEVLYCSGNQLTDLDVSRNPVLVTLDCSNNKLTALDVSCNANLQYFYCENNQLTSLDVSNHTVLASLDCDRNRLTQLKVKNCTKLSNLSCADNQLTALDVSDNTALVTLDCYNNDLTVLDVRSHSNLATLGCGKNQLTSLCLDNTAVSNLSVSGADNQYSILVGTDRRYALNRLPGSFDVTRAMEMEDAVRRLRQTGQDSLIRVETIRIEEQVEDSAQLVQELENALSNTWDMWYDEARSYYVKHGNLKVPKRYVTESGMQLGVWIQTQRAIYNGSGKGELSPQRVEALNAIGMVWGNLPDNAWNEAWELARQKSAKRAPRRHSNCVMTAERVEKLEKIGVVWEAVK